MDWKNQKFFLLLQAGVPGEIHLWARSTRGLFAVLLPCCICGGALQPPDLKGLFCSGFV